MSCSPGRRPLVAMVVVLLLFLEEAAMSGDDKCQPPHHMRCHNGKCIMTFFKCDGDDDCGDWSDETNCNVTDLSFKSCDHDEFRCGDNTCIPEDWVCDGKDDCRDTTDEMLGCTKKLSCNEDFQCSNHHCIPKEWQCDGNNDCSDGSDEVNCRRRLPMADCTIANNVYPCRDGLNCIELTEVCDGIPHCTDKSDEGSNCIISKSHCLLRGCSYKCQPTPDGPQCLCTTGFKLVDGKYCTDVDECETYSVCSQKCKNTNGSYECYCDKGYTLQSNNYTCTANEGEAVLLFSTKTEVRAFFMKNDIYLTIAENQKHIAGVAFDGLYIYWTSVREGEEAIMRSNDDGSIMDVLVNSGLSLPEDLAIDLVTGNIYFTDGEESYLGVCTKTGRKCTILVNEDVRKPRGIALMVQTGNMFWSDWGDNPKIATAGMDGASPRIFVADVHWPNGITIDLGNLRVYWVDAKLQTIESVKTDGSDRRVVLTDIVKHPYSIAVFEDTLYWSDWQGKQILSCNKFTGKDHKVLVRSRKNHIYGINIYHPVLHPKITSPCKDAGCSDICMLAQKDTYTCACPEGMELSADKHSCRGHLKKEFVIAAAGNRIVKMEHKIMGKQSHSVIMPNGINKIEAITYNQIDDLLILSDSEQKKIFTLSIETRVMKLLTRSKIGKITSLTFDPYGNNLYWTDSERRTVEVMSMSTNVRAVLLKDIGNDSPVSIAVVPEEGYMFIASGLEGKVHIDKMFMDGSGKRTRIMENIFSQRVSLWYESQLHKVFWADAKRNAIKSIDIDGGNKLSSRKLIASPEAVTSLGQDLFWTARGENFLYWANKYYSDAKVKRVMLDVGEAPAGIVLTAMKELKTLKSHPCHVNGGCTHLCLLRGYQHVCGCPEGMVLENDNITCIDNIVCEENEFRCEKDKKCIFVELRCDGVKNCPNGDDEKDCPKCKEQEFMCNNKECISLDMKCDGVNQCLDGSDEMFCQNTNCNSDTQFECKSGKCIDIHMHCDFYSDCEDGSDERNCESVVCKGNEFRCKMGACIPSSWECDGEVNCPDASDEHDQCSTPTCDVHEFTCNNGHCVDAQLICNSIDECGDGSDEKLCAIPSKETISCSKEEFFCTADGPCIPLSQRCDGNADCPKAQDERDCGCDPQEFECKNEKCISSSWVCDTIDDCGDKSDEALDLCSNKNKGAKLCDYFKCPSGKCLKLEQLCDGAQDCEDGSDEGGKCESACAVNGENPCDEKCKETPAGPQCYCEAGYELQMDGRSCYDVNECLQHVCSQVCLNNPGSFRCICMPEFELKLDRISCKAKGPQMEYIYVVDTNQIRKASQSLSHVDVIYKHTFLKVNGLDVDSRENTVYWSVRQTNTIYYQALNSHNRTSITGLGNPTEIALDWITKNLYYVNEFTEKESFIQVCNLTAKLCARVVNGEHNSEINNLAVDPLSGFLFWTETSLSMFDATTCTILSADMSGANRKLLVQSNVGYVTGLAVDPVMKQLYWADQSSNVIETVSYYGQNRQKILTKKVRNPTRLVLFEESLYWTSSESGLITKCQLFGVMKKCENIHINVLNVDYLTIIQQSRQMRGHNPCEAQTCSHLCVLSPHGAECLCSDGSIVEAHNKCKNKEQNIPMPRLIFPGNANNRNIFTSKTKQTSAEGSWSLAAVLTVTFLVLAMIGAAYYVYKRQMVNLKRLDVSVHFQNPGFGFQKTRDLGKPIASLQPGEHEYINPMQVITEEGTLEKRQVEDKGPFAGILKRIRASSHSAKSSDSDSEVDIPVVAKQSQNINLIA